MCIFKSWGFWGVAYNNSRINETEKETKNKELVPSQAQNEAERETKNKLFILISWVILIEKMKWLYISWVIKIRYYFKKHVISVLDPFTEAMHRVSK